MTIDNAQLGGASTSAGDNLDVFLASVERQAFVIAMASCRDEQTALDIVQDSMLGMIKHYANKPATQWRPLFFKVLNNRITDSHRKRGFANLTRWFGQQSADEPVSTDAVDQIGSDTLEPEAIADSMNLNSSLNKALSQLSNKQRQALIYRLWLGMSVKETAEAMSISEGSVKTHLSRAVAEMRLKLHDFGGHE